MDDAERRGRREELRSRALEAALATGLAMAIVVVVLWVLTNAGS